MSMFIVLGIYNFDSGPKLISKLEIAHSSHLIAYCAATTTKTWAYVAAQLTRNLKTKFYLVYRFNKYVSFIGKPPYTI